MGNESVAIYSLSNKEDEFVKLADYSICITYTRKYLVLNNIIICLN